MKLKVLKGFRDKITKKVYKPGEEIDHLEDARAVDAINRKLVEEVKTKADKQDKGKEPVTDIDLAQSWQKVVADVKVFTDVDKLRSYLEKENKADKPRESVTKAINERINELAG